MTNDTPTPKSISFPFYMWRKIDRTAKGMQISRTALLLRMAEAWFAGEKK